MARFKTEPLGKVNGYCPLFPTFPLPKTLIDLESFIQVSKNQDGGSGPDLVMSDRCRDLSMAQADCPSES